MVKLRLIIPKLVVAFYRQSVFLYIDSRALHKVFKETGGFFRMEISELALVLLQRIENHRIQPTTPFST